MKRMLKVICGLLSAFIVLNTIAINATGKEIDTRLPEEKYDKYFYEYYYVKKPVKQTWPYYEEVKPETEEKEITDPKEKYDPYFYEYYYGDTSVQEENDQPTEESVGTEPEEIYIHEEPHEEQKPQEEQYSERPNNAGFPDDIWQSTIDRYGPNHSVEYLRYRQGIDYVKEHMDEEREWCRNWLLDLTKGG